MSALQGLQDAHKPACSMYYKALENTTDLKANIAAHISMPQVASPQVLPSHNAKIGFLSLEQRGNIVVP